MTKNASPQVGLGPLLDRLARLEAQVSRLASQQRPPTLPIVSGVGKTTVTDADFESTPGDGLAVIVKNTTDSTRRIAVREDGSWVVSAALS